MCEVQPAEPKGLEEGRWDVLGMPEEAVGDEEDDSLMDAGAEVDRLLKEYGAVLSRSRKHQIWKFPDGKTFTKASTPSDWRAPLEQLQDLKKVLGIVDTEKGKPGERRERKPKHERVRTWTAEPTGGGALAEKLKVTGVLEKRLRAEIEELRKPKCWWCKIKAWWRETK